MPDSHVTVAVTGAAGQIGYAVVFRIASGQMFGPQTSVDLQLLELEAALPALQAWFSSRRTIASLSPFVARADTRVPGPAQLGHEKI